MAGPNDVLRSIVNEIEASDDRIHSENVHKSEVYKKAKSDGYNVKALRKVIAARRLDAAEREQNDADFDLYWSAIHGLVHAHVEIIDEFDSETGEFTEPANASPEAAAADSGEESGTLDSLSASQSTGNVGVSAGRLHSSLAMPTESTSSVPVDTHQPETATSAQPQGDSGTEADEATAESESAGGENVDAAADSAGVARTAPAVASKKLKMNPEFFDAPHPACKRPEFCGGNSNLGLCETCRASIGQAHPITTEGLVSVEHQGSVQ